MEEKEQEKKSSYDEAVEKRFQEVEEAQTISHEYELTCSGMNIILCLPKRVMEQKRIISLYSAWYVNQNDIDACEKYYSAVASLIVVNGKRLVLDATDLEPGIIDALMRMYGDFMLLPFLVRSTKKREELLNQM